MIQILRWWVVLSSLSIACGYIWDPAGIAVIGGAVSLVASTSLLRWLLDDKSLDVRKHMAGLRETWRIALIGAVFVVGYSALHPRTNAPAIENWDLFGNLGGVFACVLLVEISARHQAEAAN
jgi:hypothetical protein